MMELTLPAISGDTQMQRRPRKPKIIEYENPKAAAGGGGSSGGRGGGRGPRGGGSGGGDDGRFRPGQSVVCRVIKAEPGGYSVVTVKHNLPAFLPTQALLREGEEILAQFVCIHNHRIFLSARFSNNVSRTPQLQPVRWEEQPDELASAMKFIDDQHPPLSIPWSDKSAGQRDFHYKRASDLILPPLDQDSFNEFKIEDYDLEWLLTDLEGGRKTGCVKLTSTRSLSRSAVLLYRGRVVGCMRSCKMNPETATTEESLTKVLSDLEVPDSMLQIYDLPENVVLAISALFLGYPVQRNDDYDARDYYDYICDWLEDKGMTACLAITVPATASTCLGFIHKGQCCGAFYLDEQKYEADKEFVYALLRKHPEATIEASILPHESTASEARFGFSLSMANAKRKLEPETSDGW